MDKRHRFWDLEQLSQLQVLRPIEIIDDGPIELSAPGVDGRDNVTQWDDADPEDRIVPDSHSVDVAPAPAHPSSITLIHAGCIITRSADQAGIDIGRGRNQATPSSLRVDHHRVSRWHCKIEYVNSAFHVIDRSKNGTMIIGDSGKTVRAHRIRRALTDPSGWIVLGRSIHAARVRYHVLLSLSHDGSA